MSEIDDQASLLSMIEIRKKDSVSLLREAKPVLIGAPQVYSLKIPHEGLDHPLLSNDTLHEQFFCTSGLRPDMLVVHDLPITQGILRVVVTYTEKLVFPIEYILLIRGRIPGAAYINRRSWKAVSERRNTDDFCRYLDTHTTFQPGFSFETSFPFFNWGAYQRRIRRPMAWTAQIFPFGKDQFVWIYQKPYRTGFFGSVGESSFQIQKAADLGEQIQKAVDDFGYSGLPGHAEAVYPTISMVALPEYCRRESLPFVSETRVVGKAREKDEG